jgi:pimeloyl-ACP methyl ester carboxylesterase
MSGARLLLTALAALLVGVLLAPAGATALTLRPCADQPGFGCGTLRVPLDRTGATPGTVALRVAAEDSKAARAKPGLLIALSGGPGQSGADGASSFAQTLKPLLRDHRLVTLDQRGTGRSGALACPEVQRLDGLDAFTPAAVAACAQRVGPRRRFYGTRDTVADLDAIRVAFGAHKLSLMGVSYGTYVAAQYARVHPATTEQLVLDSVVGPDGVNPFLLDSYSRLGRILREQCARLRCRGVTADPLADVGVLVRQLQAGSIRGRTLDARGHAHTATYTTGEQLFFALIAGDLNPYLQAALPGAIAAAAAGDPAPLARLRAVAAGGPTLVRDLSAGLNVITGCVDARLPYALTSPLAGRRAAAEATLAGVDPAAYAPWDAGTVLSSSYADDCLAFPDAGNAPSAAPLPKVPTLLLSGRLDIRTPLENAQAVQAQIPGAQRVTVPGTGHDELDSDSTGCAALALRRYAAGRRIGTPCAGKTNGVTPFPRPPRALSAYRSAPGVRGDRGRVLFAVLDTAADARVTLLQRLFGGLPLAAGGLRSGRFSSDRRVDRVRLADYGYLRGVRVTGTLRPRGGALVGRVAVRAPHGLGGTLVLTTRGAAGTLGGRAVRYRPSAARAAAARADLRLAPRAAALRARLPARRQR